jgi:preprotein translocase subunit SecB
VEQSEQENIVFNIEKIYIKDISYEAPSVPSAFIQAQNAAAEIGIQLGVEHGALSMEQGIYEVVLNVTATAKREDKNLFLVEVKQAGIFRINGVEGDVLRRALEVSCANVLLPFVRETINDLVGRGGFPQLLINPINFEVLYEQKQAAQTNPARVN